MPAIDINEWDGNSIRANVHLDRDRLSSDK
jgi:hypothetical protein